MFYNYSYKTIIGTITICSDDNAIVRLDFGSTDDFTKKITPVIKETYRQLDEYFNRERKKFDLPLSLIKGTDFQKKVWSALCDIPYGKTRSYKQIAEAIGNDKACRAVGNANNKNNIPIIIPCHRVIGTDGSLVGFAGNLDIKQKLLDIESGF